MSMLPSNYFCLRRLGCFIVNLDTDFWSLGTDENFAYVLDGTTKFHTSAGYSVHTEKTLSVGKFLKRSGEVFLKDWTALNGCNRVMKLGFT
jgi:hypothetical protein